MAQDFSAGAGVVQESARIVEQARGDLRTRVTQLCDKMEQVKAHWHGQGATSFHQVSNAWRTQTQDIVDVLEAFEANLTGTQRQYDADDAAAAASLSKYNSMFGN
ncbi:WXG100 family type VII secretion target [Phycicoccus sp. CSK15P-2]|uniref:WXG100 family type VII secretion target n=1 Tax=Phycicoccus sp. CSK15P-2 TaxID=2807627 RepID=UPI0019508F8A|nr:WXG100 family type VII secretion target [Phycicoccus sp. CSK15P-2]MBM6404232.1 WXG100 family type VII secretion target [Phycicoccus sp. CSK15P-2]